MSGHMPISSPSESDGREPIVAGYSGDAWGVFLEAELPPHRQAATILRLIWGHPSNRGKRLRKVMEAVVYQLRGRLLKRPTLVRIGEHSRLWAHLHWTSAAEVVYANPPAVGLLVWRQWFQPGDLFVDVGANVGVYTVWAVDCGARVVSVEPINSAVDRLRENLALNGYEVELYQVALADKSGRVGITTDKGVANHLLIDQDYPEEHSEIVPVMTLDEVIGDRVAAGVKVDAEGAELLVLEGAKNALADHRIRLLQLEWNSCSVRTLGQDRSPVADLLSSFGYELFRPNDEGVLLPLQELDFGPDVFAKPRD
jgi:FkbM family methyltransferase